MRERALGAGGGVVKLYEVIETDADLFFVMEYCAMGAFVRLFAITAKGGFPPHIVKDIFTQIANAVHYIHSVGVYHRDLKPENLLLSTSDMTVRLADFGLATDEDWSDNMGCGSVRYMSPECLGIPLEALMKHPPSNRLQNLVGYSPLKNDVWSLGVILMNLIFARNPWHSPKDPFCSQRYLYNQEFALRDEFNLSPEFDQILRRCFDPNPDTRCTVLELRDAVWALPSF
ncbi:kinase-like domain-containing protein, partial [Chytriomyces sp. MP71]